MRKPPLFFLLLLFLINCSDKIKTEQFVGQTADKRDSAVLKLRINDDEFFGHYKVYYYDKTSDSGNIKGRIIGDTLIGRFNYISRHNIKQQSPVVFLRQNEKIKLGTGEILNLYNISFYDEKTITFPDSLLIFKPQ